MGPAKWHMENGELIGTPGPSGAGGWLVLDRSYQDIGLFTQFRCTDGCETGVLFRAEKTPGGGMKGTYALLSGTDIEFYSVTVDADGKILERIPLRRGGGQMRIAPPFNPASSPPRRPPISGFNPYEAAPGVNLPFRPPDSKLSSNQWNQVS
jgi:hypothetical protein